MGGAGGGSAGCHVTLMLVPMLSQTPDHLVAGPDARIKVRATVSNPGFGVPNWTWIVINTDAPMATIDIKPVSDADPNSSTREIAINSPGRYQVTAAADIGGRCSPVLNLTVNAPGPASYLFRVTPPMSLALEVPAQESQHILDPQRTCAGTKHLCLDQINLASGDRVAISPQNSGDHTLIPAYVRVSLLNSFGSLTVEGYTGKGPVNALFLPLANYNVLIIPDGAFAPALLFQKNRTNETTEPSLLPLLIDQGTLVAGTVQNSDGKPMVGARLMLYLVATGTVDHCPSTVGITDQTGYFSLRTRAGPHSVLIVPPAAVGLPDARVAVNPGIDFPAGGVLDVRWKAVNRVPFSVVVKTNDGTSTVAGSRVRAELQDPLQTVATVTVSAGSFSATADTGDLHPEVVTNAAGIAVFPDLPLGTYDVSIVPPASLPEAAVTTTRLSLTTAANTVTVPLSPHLTLSGTLLPKGATTGVRLTGQDMTSKIPTPTVSAIVGDQGGYSMTVDPQRKYLLVAEPPAGSTLARTMFLKEVNTADTLAPNWTVDTAASVDGVVNFQGPVAGALVQVYCSASVSVSCLDSSVPIAEAVTRADGTYTLTLPAPTL